LASYSFSKKILQFSFTLGTGTFGGTGQNTATIPVEGTGGESPASLRATAIIEENGGPTSANAECWIYGLPLSLMNQLTTLGKQFNANAYGKNQISIYAGDDKSGVPLVFTGTVYEAYMDGMASMPRVPFRVRATGDWGLKMKMIPPTSVQGNADVATTMQKLASQAGLAFENGGVNVKVNNPYLPGSIRIQISTLASMAGIQHLISKGTLAIWPTGQARQGGGHIVSRQTGMVGYPAVESTNIVVKELYDPSFDCGHDFTIQSDVTAANGTWNCIRLVRELESEMPSGKWFQILYGNPTEQKNQMSGAH